MSISRGREPPDVNGQTFGPCRAPGTTRSRQRLRTKEIYFSPNRVRGFTGLEGRIQDKSIEMLR